MRKNEGDIKRSREIKRKGERKSVELFIFVYYYTGLVD